LTIVYVSELCLNFLSFILCYLLFIFAISCVCQFFNPLTPTVVIRIQKHPVPDRVKQSFVNFDIRALWRSALSVRVPGCQKITNEDLTQSATKCFIAEPIWQQWASKG